ncbi:MAG: hypothetical protein ACLR0U_20935 [Enterocloster clostridioformis]
MNRGILQTFSKCRISSSYKEGRKAMKYVELGRTGTRASILGMGGHEYLQNGKSRGFNEDFKRSTTPGEILEGFGQKPSGDFKVLLRTGN